MDPTLITAIAFLISAISELISAMTKAASLKLSKFFQFVAITFLIVTVALLAITVAKQPNPPPAPTPSPTFRNIPPTDDISPIPTLRPTPRDDPPTPTPKSTEEEKAKSLFDEAKKIKPLIREKIDRAKRNVDLEEIKNARVLVNDGIRKLKAIPLNTLISEDVDKLLREFQDKLNDFDRQIERGCVEGSIGICLRK